MNANEYLDDEELALYALRLLPQEDASAISKRLAQSAQERQRLARLEIALGAYAENAVELHEAPTGSADRLMDAIAKEVRILQMPSPVPQPSFKTVQQKQRGPVVPSWIGWAVAAMLLITCGWLLQRQSVLHRQVEGQSTVAQQRTEEAQSLSRERDSLKRELQEQAAATEVSRRTAEQSGAESEKLRADMASQAARVEQERARAGNLAAQAEATAQERDVLKRTIDAQAGQVAQLSAQAASARQVSDALSNPAALRVSLTVPKQKPAPSGRGTYVAADGTLVFTGSNLASLRPNTVYELWVLPADGSNPIPAGTFTPDAAGNASIVSTHFQKLIAAKGFAITVEKMGGAQTPTLPLVLAGTS